MGRILGVCSRQLGQVQRDALAGKKVDMLVMCTSSSLVQSHGFETSALT